MKTFKRCNKCGVEKSVVEFFRERRNKDGRRGNCKVCQQPYLKDWREKNKERRQLRDKEYYQRNKAVIRLKRKAYLLKWYLKNKEHIQQQHKDWAKSHRDICANITARYKSRKINLEATLTNEQWEAIKKAYNYRCAYCGNKADNLEREHVIPVKLGGPFVVWNIVPACHQCNAHKHVNAPNVIPSKRLLL